MIGAVDTGHPKLIATIPMPSGTWPSSIAITPDGSKAYVANLNNTPSTGTVTVLTGVETPTPSVLTTLVPSGNSDPADIAISPDGSTVYVVEGFDEIRTITGAETATPAFACEIPMPAVSFPVAIGITPDGTRAYVAEWSNNAVQEITGLNTATPTLLPAMLAVGSVPISISITPDGHTAYVSNRDSRTLSVIDGANTDSPTVSATTLSVRTRSSPPLGQTRSIAALTVVPGALVLPQASTHRPRRWNTGRRLRLGLRRRAYRDDCDADDNPHYLRNGRNLHRQGDRDGLGRHLDDADLYRPNGLAERRAFGSSLASGDRDRSADGVHDRGQRHAGCHDHLRAQATLSETGLPVGATGTVAFTSGATTLCTIKAKAGNELAVTSATFPSGAYLTIAAHFERKSAGHSSSDATNTVSLTVLSLTPVITALSPASGLLTGGRRSRSPARTSRT